MTNNINTQPYKGARDFYPEEMRVRNYIFETWKKVCVRYGFEEYDFPILEPLEIFAAKTGEEIVNTQLFSLEDKGGRSLVIRPELTPGTVRMLAAKYKELRKPVRWFMIGNNWRFEKPQLGRGREFYQLELNTFGVDDVVAELEIFSVIVDIMKEFGADESMYEIRVSDRKLVGALLKDTLKLDDETATATRRLMDKRAKMEQEDFFEALAKEGLTQDQCQKVEAFMNADLQTLADVIDRSVLDNNQGFKDITRLFELLELAGLSEYCKFEPSIIRGFDYSDGLVYELFDKNPANARSIFGGERFDGLINIFGDYDLAATGFAMGDITFLEFLNNWNLLPPLGTETEYLVTQWPSETEPQKYLQKTLEVAQKLRAEGKNVMTWLEPNTKLDKQLKYADRKGIKYAVIIGPEEMQNNTITVKNLETGEQETKD
jgi:histidyl-tRNA synthetase